MSEPEPRATRIAPATPEAIEAAAASLRRGGLVAMPTETVYGLAGLATSDAAVAAIYAAKGRPSFNPLIAHFAEAEAAFAEGEFCARARALARAFWPGPLTIVAPAPRTRVSLLARAGLDTLALRLPAHDVARALIAAAGAPLVAPSANRSGRVSPTTAEHVKEDLDGRIDWILDAGPTRHGLESTIVACLGGPVRLLRPGAIERERLEAALGEAVLSAAAADDAPIAPGMLSSHYSPRAKVRLNAGEFAENEAALDFGGALAATVIPAQAGIQGRRIALSPLGSCFRGNDNRTPSRLDLSPSGDLVEAAANLFAYLRRLDAEGFESIAVAPVPEHGLGAAINDRLARAAAPK
jgi:L-threonylcarbamoyladenylate synthase